MRDHPNPVEADASASNEQVRAIADMRFTERQARFLVLVMRHAGVCIPRQYASFAGIANGGRKCNAFFARLVRRGLAAAITCVHNRARLYHVHARGLYAAIGEGSSRYRRPVPAGRTAERLMLLDAVLTTPDLDWLTTAAEKRAYLERLTGSTAPEPASDPPADPPPAAVRDLPGTLPIGLDCDGRVVLLYLATDPWSDRFRTFLQGHARLLRVAPTWTIRLAFPHPLEHFYSACLAVIHDELESAFHPATIWRAAVVLRAPPSVGGRGTAACDDEGVPECGVQGVRHAALHRDVPALAAIRRRGLRGHLVPHDRPGNGSRPRHGGVPGPDARLPPSFPLGGGGAVDARARRRGVEKGAAPREDASARP